MNKCKNISGTLGLVWFDYILSNINIQEYNGIFDWKLIDI